MQGSYRNAPFGAIIVIFFVHELKLCFPYSIILYSGLRLNYDLTRGSTSRSIGFDSEELIAKGVQVFEVGLGMMSCDSNALFSISQLQLSNIQFAYSLISHNVQLRCTGSFEMLTTSRYVVLLEYHVHRIVNMTQK